MNKKGKLAAQLQLTMKGNSQCNLLTANHKIQQRHTEIQRCSDTEILRYKDTFYGCASFGFSVRFSLHDDDDDDDHVMFVSTISIFSSGFSRLLLCTFFRPVIDIQLQNWPNLQLVSRRVASHEQVSTN